MPIIQFAPQAQPCQVEDFPKDCERSHKGAIHVRPGATKTVTQAELEHLQAQKIPLRVIRASDPDPKEPQTTPSDPKTATTVSAPSAPSSTSAGTGGASGADSGDDSSVGGRKKRGLGGQ